MRLTSYKINPEKIKTAIAEIASDAAGTWKNKLAIEASINRTKPMTKNLPIKLKSLFDVVAIPERTKKIVAVPPAASVTI